MTRVLIVEAAGNLWGSERALLDLLGAVPELEVAVCCPPGKPLTAELTERRTRTLPYLIEGLHLKSRLHRARAAVGILRACLEFRPDVIHLNQSGSYKVAVPAARLLGIPMVAHIRIFEDVDYLARQHPDPHLLRAVIAISEAVKDEILRYPELSAIPMHRIYDSYVRMATSRTLTARFQRRVACVGRLVPIKGQDILIRALGWMHRQGTSAECVIAGDGPKDFVDALKRTMSEESLDAAVRWLGFVHSIGPLLHSCGVLVCPSHREPLGRVIFEAWDAGVVPVAFAGSGGAAEVIQAASGGILYEEQSPESLGDALATALDLDPGEAERFVANGRTWMAQHCDSVGYGRRLSSIFAEAGKAQVEPL